MIARLLRNPAAILLCVIVLVAVMATVWAVVVVVEDTGDVWLNPEPSEAAIAQYRIVQFAAAIPAPATLVGVLALLGVLFVGAVTSRVVDADLAERSYSATRTMSAAGSTRNRAAMTVPNSSPSISNSSGSASISMSTERPRE